MRTYWITLAIVLATCASVAEAQNCRPRPTGRAGCRPGQVRIMPYSYHAPYFFHRNHAATAAESYARGAAEVIRARGEYNLLTSQAMINATEAHRRALENKLRGTETYFRMREMNKSFRAAERKSSRAKYAQAAQSKPKNAQPPRPQVVDQASGTVLWPSVLQQEKYAAYRIEVESVLGRRSTSLAVGAEDNVKLAQVLHGLLAELKEHIREMSPSDYVAAKRYIESISWEVRPTVS